MKRRNALKWLSALLGAGCAAVVALPGVSYLFATVRRTESSGEQVQRVARLRDLPVNKPVEAAITGRRRDAWSLYPEEVIGRVWLLRKTDDDTQPDAAGVVAFSGVCPHLRCAVQRDAASDTFVCPCHRGRFGLMGERLSENGEANPANRGLDRLKTRVVADAAGELWVEVTWQNFQPAIAEQVAMG